jgi:hypothetical protein
MKLTSRDVSMDVRQLGKKISEAHKAQLADCSERCVSNVSARDDIVSRVPFSSLGSVTSVTKKVAVQGTAPSRVLSRGHKTTGIARIIVPLIQKVDSAKPSELPRDICAVKPIATSKQATSAHQGTLRPPAVPGPSQLCAGVIIPTAPLPTNGSTETARVPRNRRSGPPPFKPISRPRCLISTSDPQNLMPVPTVRPSSRMPVAKAEDPATRRTSSQIDQSRSRLSITDLQMSPKARKLVAPRCNQQAVRQKKPVRGGHAVREPFVPAIAHVPRDVSRTPPKCDIKVEDSTTPKGDPPVQATSHVQHPYVNVEESTSTTPRGEPPVRATAHVLRGVVKYVTSTTPRTHISWPAHCEDIFAPSSRDAYVPPRRVSERLKRAPRLLAYRPPRDYLATPSPSPRVWESYSTAPQTPLRLSTPSGQYLKQFFSSPQSPLPPSRIPIDQWLASIRLRLDALAF